MIEVEAKALEIMIIEVEVKVTETLLEGMKETKVGGIEDHHTEKMEDLLIQTEMRKEATPEMTEIAIELIMTDLAPALVKEIETGEDTTEPY